MQWFLSHPYWVLSAKSMPCIKIASKQNRFKQRQSFKREKGHVQRLFYRIKNISEQKN